MHAHTLYHLARPAPKMSWDVWRRHKNFFRSMEPLLQFMWMTKFCPKFRHYHSIKIHNLGVFDKKIEELADRARHDANRSNLSRNLHAYIHKKDKTLPVPITSVMTPVKTRVSRRFATARRPWPVLHLSSWIKTGMEADQFAGFFLLNGFKLDNLVQAEDNLELFRDRYKSVDSNTPPNPRRTLPFYVHGDEGRGQVKRPVLVISFQGLMSWDGNGVQRVNSVKSLRKLRVLFCY